MVGPDEQRVLSELSVGELLQWVEDAEASVRLMVPWLRRPK